MPVEPGEKNYDDPRDLAQNLIDYMDTDTIRFPPRRQGAGGRLLPESGSHPTRASNGPLLSVEQLGLVEGFDVQLMNAMRPTSPCTRSSVHRDQPEHSAGHTCWR